LALDYSVESEPRGTGGAVLLALPLATSRTVLIVNGDTVFDIDYQGFLGKHDQLGGTATLALAQVANENRFGAVRIRGDGVVDGFVEKGTATGFISGGVYAANRNGLQHVLGRDSSKNLSLEEQVWPMLAGLGQLCAVTMSGPFLDMGTPEAYGLAGEVLRQHDW
jgi:NDP-sugar pyrophosphorylase family protein